MPRSIKKKNTARYASVRNLRKTLVPMTALVIVLSVVFSVESWHANRREQLRHFTALAELGAAALNSYLGQLEGALRLAGMEFVRAGASRETAQRVQQAIRRTYPELQNLALLPLPDAARSHPHAAASDAAGEPAAILIERPMWHEPASEWRIPVRYPVRGIGARYAFDAALPLHAAHRLWQHVPLPEGGRLGVIRDDGHLVIMHPLPDRVAMDHIYGAVRTGSPLYNHVRRNGFPERGVVSGAGSMDGRPRVWTYRRLENYPLTLYTSMPSAYLWKTWWQQVRYAFLLLAAGLTGGSIVYAWIVRRLRAWELARERSERRIRRLNAALARRVAQLEASNRELEAFSYTVSHDLRGPLRVMHGFSERLATQYGSRLDTQGMHYVERIGIGARRMAALVDGLLQLSRVTRVKVEQQPVDLTHEAKSLARELAQLHPGRVVQFTVDDGMVGRGTPALLRDLLRNLLENAWKFTAGCDRPAIRFSMEERDGERVYVVRDNGVGFDMRYAGKLFTMFQRLHGSDYEGTGVGLATAARIVAMHGGRLWAESRKNEGAAFYFVLEPRAR